jgi:type IV pilus assembly protein PilW
MIMDIPPSECVIDTRTTTNRIAPQRGVTLIELMVAMAIGLVIIAAVSFVYLSGVQGFRVQDAQSRAQEDARFIVDTMSRDIRMAGYFGCNRPTNPGDSQQATLEVVASQPLMTVNTSWLSDDTKPYDRFVDLQYLLRSFVGSHPSLPAVAASRLPGTEVLMVLRGGEDARPIIPNDDPNNVTDFSISSTIPGVGSNAVIAVSDCYVTKIMKPSVRGVVKPGLPVSLTVDNGVNRNNSTTAQGTGKIDDANVKFDANAVAMNFQPSLYFVAPASGTNTQPTLRRLGIVDDSPVNNGGWAGNGGTTIATGVSALRFEYSLFNDPVIYTTQQMEALGGNAWQNVTSVRVTFRMIAEQGGTSIAGARLESRDYQFTVGVRGRQYQGRT